MKIFISYSHNQGDWVCNRLVPSLTAAGAEVLLDKDLFTLGKAVVGQMDTVQDQADKQLLVLSEDYFTSKYCQHEMKRALKTDPKFNKGLVLPVIRQHCDLPKAFSGWNQPLNANLQDDSQADRWQALLKACVADGLGCTVPEWLRVRDELVRQLGRNKSVNLVVTGKANWLGLVQHVIEDYFHEMAYVNLEDPDTSTRAGLLSCISQAIGSRKPLRDAPYDLSDFKILLANRPMTHAVLCHFDMVHFRDGFNVDFFAALRYSIMDQRKLTLLIQSRTPFVNLLPKDHPMSEIDLTTIELVGKL
ncbi:MAG: toll/interleukin-1 receptor domain-containing protein [Methylococcales bacterium]